MTPAEADKAISEVWGRMTGTVRQYSDDVTDALNYPGTPMLLRCMALAYVIAGAAQGTMVVINEDGPEQVRNLHMSEMLPDLVITLRAAAALFEEANRLGTN